MVFRLAEHIATLHTMPPSSTGNLMGTVRGPTGASARAQTQGARIQAAMILLGG